MTGGNRVVAIGAGGPETDPGEILLTEELAPLEEEQVAPAEWPEEAPEPIARRSLLAPALALSAVALWSGLFAWSLVGTINTMPTPAQLAGWIRDWSVPVLLVGVVWLLAMRNSKRTRNPSIVFCASTAHV